MRIKMILPARRTFQVLKEHTMKKINLPLSRHLFFLPATCLFFSMFYGTLVCFPAYSWGSFREYGKRPCLNVPGNISLSEFENRYAFDVKKREDKDPLRERYEEWQNLPQQEKEMIRRRMDQWNRMSPQERQRYERRFEQWQQLPPEERGPLDQKLDRWRELPLEEKDQIRKRFTK
jgi:hypothetical protein